MDSNKNTGSANTGNSNRGYSNSGNYNSGNYNSGNYNSGYSNSGHYNSGSYNSGYSNSGYSNSGHSNSGHSNSGHYNSGHYNSGNYNIGNYNSGNYNSGYSNSGNYNSGNYNSGYYNSGKYNSGFFCRSEDPEAICFDKPTGMKRSEFIKKLPNILPQLTRWVSESEMTDEEKKKIPTFYATEGYLKKLTYFEAWDIAWKEAQQSERDKMMALPNFDAVAFKEITGIDTRASNEVSNSCAGKVIIIEGKQYRLEEVK